MSFDLFILAILIFTTFRGAAKGVAWQLAGIAALVLCFMFATPLSLTLAPMIKLDAPLNRWVAMLGIYLVFSFGTFAVARAFREALEKAKFVEFDRHLGALFGFLKGVVISLVITFFVVAMSKQAREVILKTQSGYAAAHIMNAIDPVMPKELHAILEPYIHNLDAVDPELAAEREKHHEELHGKPTPIRTGKGYLPTDSNADPFESEGERVDSRDPFQDDETEFGASQAKSTKNPSRLKDPEFTSEPAAPDESLDSEFGWLSDLPHLAAKITPAIKNQLSRAMESLDAEDRDAILNSLREATPDTVQEVARTWLNGRSRPPVQDDTFGSSAPPKKIKRPKPLVTPQIPNDFDSGLSIPSDPFSGQQPEGPTRIRQPDEPPLPLRERREPREPFQTREPQETSEDYNLQRQQLLRGIARVFSSRQAEQAQKMTEVDTLLLGLPAPVINGVLEDWLADLRGIDPDPDPHTDLTTAINARIARQIEMRNVPHTQLTPEWQTKLERFFKN